MFDLKCDQKVCLAQSGGKVEGGDKKVAIQNVTRGNLEVDNYTNTQLHKYKYTNTQIHKYTNTECDPRELEGGQLYCQEILRDLG